MDLAQYDINDPFNSGEWKRILQDMKSITEKLENSKKWNEILNAAGMNTNNVILSADTILQKEIYEARAYSLIWQQKYEKMKEQYDELNEHCFENLDEYIKELNDADFYSLKQIEAVMKVRNGTSPHAILNPEEMKLEKTITEMSKEETIKADFDLSADINGKPDQMGEDNGKSNLTMPILTIGTLLGAAMNALLPKSNEQVRVSETTEETIEEAKTEMENNDQMQ